MSTESPQEYSPELLKALSEYYYTLEPSLGMSGLMIDVIEYRTPYAVTQAPLVTQRIVTNTEQRALSSLTILKSRRIEYERLKLVYGGTIL